MVTHDFGEAHYLAQRVGVVHDGRIEQVGTVAEVFQRPATPFVAQFVGMKNVFPASFRENRALVEGLACPLITDGVTAGGRYVAIRPEDIRIRKSRGLSANDNVLVGTVSRVHNQGVFSDVGVRAGAVEFRTLVLSSALYREDIREGRQVTLAFDPAAVHVL
jgi:molybdate/tungstate transport system ATP-binding protein